MTEMMICPKAGEYGDCKHRKINEHRHCLPHKENPRCKNVWDKYNCIKNHCPPCILYTLQKGDKVRVTKKYDDSYMAHPMREYLGNEYEIRSIRDDLIYLRIGDVSYQWKAKDLEYIGKGDDMPEKPKYKVTNRTRTITYIYNHDIVAAECKEIFDHFFNMIYELKPGATIDEINNKDFLAWAEKDPIRIKWLIDKGYIEEVQSEYNKWEKECPFPDRTNPNTSCSTFPSIKNEFVEWAKRMPKEV